MAVKTLTIDGQRLTEALAKRKLMITHASKEIGFAASYLTDCVSRNKIPEYAMILITKCFNITYDEIKPLDKPEVTVVEKVTQNVTDLSELNEKMDTLIKLLTDLNSNVSKLGNISMQNMEYILKIKNTVAGGEHNVKCG